MVILPSFPELIFDEERHIYKYRIDDIELILPSVTQILRFVSREIYGDVPANVLESAADRGTRVHEAIEMLAKFGWMEADTEIMPYMLAYQAWEKEHNFKTLESEYRFYHRTRLYAGTADRLFMDGNDICLMDTKTSLEVHELLTAAQLYGYAEALKSHGINIKKAYILHLRNDATYNWIEANLNEGRTIFEACAYLHGAIKKG